MTLFHLVAVKVSVLVPMGLVFVVVNTVSIFVLFLQTEKGQDKQEWQQEWNNQQGQSTGTGTTNDRHDDGRQDGNAKNETSTLVAIVTKDGRIVL